MYDYLCRHGYVNEHNAKMIQLGLNRVKSFLFDLTYTVIIGGLLQIPFEALCMELSYIALRSYSGGFHASTPKKCKYYSVIWTMAGLILVRFHWTNQLITGCVLLISWLVLMVISPVESRNRRLNIREKKIFGPRARVIATAESLVAVILMLLHLYSFGYAPAVAVFMCALMGVLGMWSEKRGKTDR